MRESYLSYAMSVIASRALPDVRDGLKPVQRRILYAMREMGLDPSKQHRKCAGVIGEVLKSYHPHGDTSVYDALVRMAQEFTLRYTLVDGHGNFGSIDGDPPAAYRYTEARLARPALDALADIDKETVPFVPNFDNQGTEPTVLPGKLPQLLINGSSGIAVGMATNIPPHNLPEVVAACVLLLENPDATLDDLLLHVKGPDFPTDAEIQGLIVGPESQTWQFGSDVRLFLTMLYPLLLQVAHPTVGAGVRDHSDFEQRPWRRLLGTIDYVTVLVYGGERAVPAGRRLRELHQRFTGVREDGERYHALEPSAYAWVHATLIETYVAGHAHFGTPMTAAETERFYREYRGLGRLIGVRERDLPETWQGFRQYFERVTRAELIHNESVDRVLRAIRHVPPPPGQMPELLWRTIRIPAADALRLGGVGPMSPELRKRLRIGWGWPDELRFRALGIASRSLSPLLPESLRVTGPAQLAYRQQAIARGHSKRPKLASVLAGDAAAAAAGGHPETWNRPRWRASGAAALGDLDSLDVVRLHRELLPALAGTGDPNALDIAYSHDLAETTNAVRNGAALAAVLLNPTPVEQVDQVAAGGARMPEKSTYFYPKLSTGLLLRVEEGVLE